MICNADKPTAESIKLYDEQKIAKMYFEDLTPYEYFPDLSAEGFVNIGWLEKGHVYEQGTSSQQFHEALFRICLHSVNATRGVHQCRFCAIGTVRNKIAIEMFGVKFYPGNAEIHVPGEGGVFYAAPNLILHYVIDHGYLPPQPFIESVMKFASTI